jgi:hypothetical protein
MSHNTDIADSWEREREDPEFFDQFSPDSYAFGMNVVAHVLSHWEVLAEEGRVR